MKFGINLVFFLGIALPFASYGMDFASAIAKYRAQSSDNENEPSENTSNEPSENTSLNTTAFGREDDISHAANELDLKEATRKLEAASKATGANHALARVDLSLLAKARQSSPKIPTSGKYKEHRPIDESAVDDEEWGDTTSTKAPTPPPFVDPSHDVNNINNSESDQNEDDNRPLPDLPDQPQIEDLLLAQFNHSPVPGQPNRQLPAAPRPALPPRDEEPIIEEMPEPVDEAPALPARDLLSPEEQDATDFTQTFAPATRGVRAEIDRRNRLPQKDAPHAQIPTSSQGRRPLPSAPKANSKAHIRVELKPAPLNTTSLLLSAGLFGILTWVQNNAFAKSMPQTRASAAAQEFISLAKQAAAANAAQQLLPGKPANSLAFTAAFSILHACEVGFKKLTENALQKTKAGKKISAAYKKMPARKRKILDGASTVTSWFIKTMLARAIAQ